MMIGAEIEFRRAVPEDAAEVAALHLAVWHETNAALAPAAVVAALDGVHRLRYWTKALAEGQACIVARQAGACVGLVSFGAPNHPIFAARGEIKHFYVAAGLRQKGVGRSLLRRGFEGLRAVGFADVGLAVLRENHRARAAYAAMGGREAGGFTDAGPLWKSDNILVVWDGVQMAGERGGAERGGGPLA